MINIPVNQLDTVLVSKMIGANKDLPAVYKTLKRDQLIQQAAKASGKSLEDVLDWLKHS